MSEPAEGRKDGGTAVEENRRVSSERLRDHLGKYLGLVEHGGRDFLVTKNGRVVAHLRPAPAESSG